MSRDNEIKVRLSDCELDQLMAEVRRTGLSKASVVRSIVKQHLNDIARQATSEGPDRAYLGLRICDQFTEVEYVPCRAGAAREDRSADRGLRGSVEGQRSIEHARG